MTFTILLKHAILIATEFLFSTYIHKKVVFKCKTKYSTKYSHMYHTKNIIRNRRNGFLCAATYLRGYIFFLVCGLTLTHRYLDLPSHSMQHRPSLQQGRGEEYRAWKRDFFAPAQCKVTTMEGDSFVFVPFALTEYKWLQMQSFRPYLLLNTKEGNSWIDRCPK